MSISEMSPSAVGRLVFGPAAMMLLLSGPAMGQPAQGEKFGDWTAKCEVPQGAQKQRCLIFQQVIHKEKQKQLLQIAVGYRPANGSRVLVAAFRVPLGIYLPAGLTFDAPGAKPVRIVVDLCEPGGCHGAVQLDPDVTDAMKRGDRGTLTVQDVRRKKLQLPVSFKGITAGLAALAKD